MNSEIPDRPKPEVDQEPEPAPGGADAHLSESDVGAASEGTPAIPDVPLSAQQDQTQIPAEVQAPEQPDETEGGDHDGDSEPSA